ncbi:aspartate aminotransferase, cytoplasmic-like [Watersipora subatra]|uniref:aspartate aminotransferase, cytoplasmic-like n=1 Tax=Watersipora subatra TaxID=2589382 RepID=UPI00355B084E
MAFSSVKLAPPIEVFALVSAFNADNHPDKVNVSVGAYRTEEAKPWVLPVVRKVEASMASDQALNKEYLPVAGLGAFTEASVRILLGEDSTAIQEQRVLGIQALGGTGALRLGADLLHQEANKRIAYVSSPTWGNHIGIFEKAGYEVRKYNYWNAEKRILDIESFKKSLLEAPEGAVVVLHAIAHNPTGIDPSQEQWMEIAAIMKERHLYPFMDIAYQGFASGDLDADAWAVRYFVNQRFEMCVAQSFSKNFGLYNERVGCLAVILPDNSLLSALKSQMELIVRKMFSNPPSHGARIVSAVLSNPALTTEWKENVKVMADRIKLMRQKLYEKLRSLGTPGTWEHIVQQIGMFSFTGLNVRQCEFLTKEYHIYLMKNGRISMAGVTLKNVDYLATAIHEAVTTVADDPKL